MTFPVQHAETMAQKLSLWRVHVTGKLYSEFPSTVAKTRSWIGRSPEPAFDPGWPRSKEERVASKS